MSYAKTYLSYLFGNKRFKIPKLPQEIPWGSLSLEETLMFHALQNSLEKYINEELEIDSITPQNALQLFKFFGLIQNEVFKNRLIEKYCEDYLFFSELTQKDHPPLPEDQIISLLKKEWDQFTIFALLHPNREKKGRIIFKKKDGSFFVIKVLGMSSRGLDYYYTNGQTPQGVYRIDGVMPKADRWYEFGKYRRLILNFEMEENVKNILSSDVLSSPWWKEAILALKLGRSHLRIHGAGRINKNIFSSYFPIVPTSGCLAVSEGFGFHHQRILLDEMMKALGLNPEFSNEEKIRGRLIVIETNKIRSILNNL